MITPGSWPLKRIVFAVGMAVLIPVTFIGGCVALMLGIRHENARADSYAKAAAESDPKLKRPLASTAGRILFTAHHEGGNDFFVVDADGSGLTQLTHLPQESSDPSPPVVSPDGTRLAVSTGGRVDIVRLDGIGETTRLDRPAGSLVWSPDGKRLASLSIDDRKRLHLWVFNADGTGEPRDYAQLWPSTAEGERQAVGGIAWSIDGKRFAFALSTRPGFRRGPSRDDLYMAQADGSGLRNLSREPNGLPAYDGLAWSPDGRRLAFRGGHGIAIVDADMKWSDILIPPHETRSLQQPAWSPDGARLAWFDFYSIVVSDPDGQHPQQLTRGRCPGVQPAWSEEGLRIAFVCRDASGHQNVFVMNDDGSGLTQVTRLGAGESSPVTADIAQYPTWLPRSSAAVKMVPN